MKRNLRPILSAISLVFFFAALWLLFASYQTDYRNRAGFSKTHLYEVRVDHGVAILSMRTHVELVDPEASLFGTAPIRIANIFPQSNSLQFFWSKPNMSGPETTYGFACSEMYQIIEWGGLFLSVRDRSFAFPLAIPLLLFCLLPLRWLCLTLRRRSQRSFEVIVGDVPKASTSA